MLVLNCPNCGRRNVSEFRFGGEYRPRPRKPLAPGEEEWAHYLYMRANVWGLQKEWWFHNAGCGSWFVAERHTRTNEVTKTYLRPAPGGDS